MERSGSAFDDLDGPGLAGQPAYGTSALKSDQQFMSALRRAGFDTSRQFTNRRRNAMLTLIGHQKVKAFGLALCEADHAAASHLNR